MRNIVLKSTLLIALVGTGLMWSCRNNDVKTGDALVNEFIAVNMDYWYYWRDKITPNSNKSLAPEAYFNSLLYPFDAQARPDGDRFSRFLANASETVDANFHCGHCGDAPELDTTKRQKRSRINLWRSPLIPRAERQLRIP